MTKFYNLIFLILIISLQFSCLEKEPTKDGNYNSDFINLSHTDTLKFTSGIRAILQDNNGNYWFGSLQEGVCLFDGKTFTYFTTEHGLANNQVRTIQEDADGVIWFGTANGVSSYDGKKIHNHNPKKNTNSQNQWIKTDRDLWFNAGNNSGVYRYDGQELHYLAFPNPKIINPDNVYFVTSMSEGKDSMFWIGTYAGIYGYNGKNFIVINDETLGFQQAGEFLHIRSILEDSKGRLWIGNNGIGVLLRSGETTINFSNEMGLIHANSLGMGDPSPLGTLEHVFTIQEDSQGNIWFGDRDSGIWKYDGRTMVNYTIKDGLSDNFALSIYEDKKGELWFGLRNGDLYQFNGKSFDKRI